MNISDTRYREACQKIGFIFFDVPQFIVITLDFLNEELTEYELSYHCREGWFLTSRYLDNEINGKTIEEVLLIAIERI